MNEHFDQAMKDGHLQLIQAGKTEKMRYVAVNVAEKWSDPEEKIRAAYYAELIYRYGYKPECIGVEVTVPDRTPHDRADLVVFPAAPKPMLKRLDACILGLADDPLPQLASLHFLSI